MPSNTPSYREQVDAKRIVQIRQILRELPQACGDFIRSIAVTTGTFTRLAYSIDMRTFFGFLQRERSAFADTPTNLLTDAQIGSVTQSDLSAYIEYLTYYFKAQDDGEDSAQALKPLVNHELAIKRKLSALRSFYEFLFKNHRIEANVLTLISLPKIHEKPIIRLSQDELQRMLSQSATGEGLTKKQKEFQKLTSKRDFALISLFLGTGIRVSECVGLNLADIDLENNAFLVTRKGGNQVVLYFPPEVAEALADYIEERKQIETLPGHEDALFLSLQKRRMTQRAIQNLVKKYAAVAAPLKPRISPHKLRSTFATNLYQETGDIYLVADVLGHSSVDTTRKHYAEMTDQRRRMAAEHVLLPTREEVEKTEHQDDDSQK